MSSPPEIVLFLCTGNYYRSRFAEVLFNDLAARAGLPWRAESRGLALERGVHNVGPMSRAALARLHDLGFSAAGDLRFPSTATENDFARAALVIALKEAEHRPLLEERYPGWAERVEYWHVHDVDGCSVAEALTEIERHVRALAERLRQAVRGH
jgi:protein-tyrosine phosphatase